MADEFGPEQLVAIEYHTSDEFTFPGLDLRVDMFSFPGTPTIFFDYYEDQVGGYVGNYDDYLAAINEHLQIESPLTIDNLVFYPNDGGFTSATVGYGITLESNISAANVTAWAVVMETPVQGWQYDTDWYDYVCRSVQSQEVTVSQAGETQSFNFTFDIDPEWVADNLSVAVFIHDDDAEEVHQAATTGAGGTISVTEYTLTEMTGDGDGRFEGGESGDVIFSAENMSYPDGFTDVTVEMSSNDPSIVVTQSTVDLGDIAMGETVNNADTPLSFEVVDSIDPHRAAITLTFTSNELQSAFSFNFILGRPLLVVDGDGGEVAPFYLQVLNEDGLFYELWSSDNATLDNYFDDYKTVIWFTGDAGNGLSEDNIAGLETFLDNGGHLLLSGQDIAELMPEGSTFLADYLGVNFVMSVPTVYFVYGRDGDMFFDGVQLLLQGDQGAGNQTSVDVIEAIPGSGAVPVLDYQGTFGVAGIAKYNPDTDARVIFTGFGLEGIHVQNPSYTSRADFIHTAFDYFADPLGVEDPTPTARVTALRQNYPNPFNPSTSIRFALATDSHVSLKIFDSAGRLVSTLVDGNRAAGDYAVTWNGQENSGAEAASGVYFYQLQTDERTETKRMVLMK